MGWNGWLMSIPTTFTPSARGDGRSDSMPERELGANLRLELRALRPNHQHCDRGGAGNGCDIPIHEGTQLSKPDGDQGRIESLPKCDAK